MNKTKIEWVDYTWNPVTGCQNECAYCYARRIATRFAGSKAFPRGFEPTFHSERLVEPWKKEKPARILVSSMGDLFGPWVPPEQQAKVMAAVSAAKQHTYFFLSKYPQGFPFWPGLAWLKGCHYWVGVTVEDVKAAHERMWALERSRPLRCYVSCEPLLGPLSLRSWNVDWVIIGAMTGPGAVKPEREWVEGLIRECDERGIPVFCKDNLRAFVSDDLWRREMP